MILTSNLYKILSLSTHFKLKYAYGIGYLNIVYKYVTQTTTTSSCVYCIR